jgi:hypothetical protein
MTSQCPLGKAPAKCLTEGMDSTLPVSALVFAAALMVKHIICDGPLQTLAMVREKSRYGRPLGFLHAAIHVAGTFLICLMFGLGLQGAALLALLDGVLHYHIDFAKENLVRFKAWTTSDGPYWWAMTTDQALHHLTYLFIAYLAFTRL